MKAFLVSLAATIAIGLIAALVLTNLDWSSASVFQSPTGSVRL